MSPPGQYTSVKIDGRARAGLPSLSFPAYITALIAAVAGYYLFLLSNGTFQIFAPETPYYRSPLSRTLLSGNNVHSPKHRAFGAVISSASLGRP